MRRVALYFLIGLFALIGVCTTCTVGIVLFSDGDDSAEELAQSPVAEDVTGTFVPPSETTTPPEATQTPTAVAIPTSPTSTSTPLNQLLITVAEVPNYDRDDWRHWTDEDGDCQDTRQEALFAESMVGVVFRSESECRVTEGSWYAAYTGTTVTDPGDLDVDHLVPLANAHRSGAWAWSPEKKRDFANSLHDPDHLIAVTARANRSKGAKGPDEWRPPDESYWCEYATDWIRIKQAWDLTATRSEADALQQMLATCSQSVELAASESTRNPVPSAAPVSTPPPPTATPTPSPTPIPPLQSGAIYASCEEAAAAGEPRVQGSSGPGRGYPTWQVPSARDGDRDGVVCER